jgi:hypothetical protein
LGAKIAFTLKGRDLEARRHAVRFLDRLREAAAFAPCRAHDVWLSDYALGFITNHVVFAMQLARSQFWYGLFQTPVADLQKVRDLAVALAPASLRIDPSAFTAAYDRVVEGWPRKPGETGDSPLLIGAAYGVRILRLLISAYDLKDPYARGVAELESEFRRLSGAITLGGFISYRRRLYRYLVLRTLGEAVLGSSPADAAKAATAP